MNVQVEPVNRDIPGAQPPPLPASPSDEPAVADDGRIDDLSALLKAPRVAAARVWRADGPWCRAVRLLAGGLAFHALYGLAMGLFGGWPVAAMTAAKAPLIALASLALCVPSLYVFAGVAGVNLGAVQAVTAGAGVIAMSGWILLGLAPVSWLFAVSTNSVAFTVILNAAAWGVAVLFAARYLGLVTRAAPSGRAGGLNWWLLVYVIVSLQMATTLRPLIEKPAAGWRTPEKKFFLVHFGDCLGLR